LLTALSAGDGGASLAALARASGLTEATALRYLTTLVRLELAERDTTTGQFRLGLGLLVLGERALGALNPRRIANPFMERLRERYGETVNLAVFRRDALVLVEVLEGTHALKRGAQVGQRDPLHSTGLGKAVLAFLPTQERARLLRQTGMKRYTTTTVTEPAALEAQLGIVRQRGYAVDLEESVLGLRCVGAPVFDRRGLPGYALSISGPTMRLDDRAIARIGADLARAGLDISRRLGYAHAPQVVAAARNRT